MVLNYRNQGNVNHDIMLGIEEEIGHYNRKDGRSGANDLMKGNGNEVERNIRYRLHIIKRTKIRGNENTILIV